MNFLAWFYKEYNEGIKLVITFLVACLGEYVLLLMLWPYLPVLSGVHWTTLPMWVNITFYILVCLFSFLGLISFFTIAGLYEDYIYHSRKKKVNVVVKRSWVFFIVFLVLLCTFIGYHGGYAPGMQDGFREGLNYSSVIAKRHSEMVEPSYDQSKATLCFYEIMGLIESIEYYPTEYLWDDKLKDTTHVYFSAIGTYDEENLTLKAKSNHSVHLFFEGNESFLYFNEENDGKPIIARISYRSKGDALYFINICYYDTLIS